MSAVTRSSIWCSVRTVPFRASSLVARGRKSTTGGFQRPSIPKGGIVRIAFEARGQYEQDERQHDGGKRFPPGFDEVWNTFATMVPPLGDLVGQDHHGEDAESKKVGEEQDGGYQ